ncbi:MAG: DEAD/DEAH box helicase [Pirellulaceae bacterium]
MDSRSQPATPAVISWQLTPQAQGEQKLFPMVETFASGWQTALHRALPIQLEQLCWQVPPPTAVSIPIDSSPVRTVGMQFEPVAGELPPVLLAAGKQEQASAAESEPLRKSRQRPSARTTRLQPPKDIVKLEDRLYYLLQPPLESLLASQAMKFPFAPFPFQYQGIAFLYPRHAAILADEMGLGKTMQAITAVRMLLRSGQLRRVLLICPKPLVSNWQREFQLWAPEIPLTVISGAADRRRWQWQQRGAPVVIANYELLIRDADSLSQDASHFDLVMLDEAQRIKNRHSQTNQVVCSIARTRSWALTGTPVENSLDDLVGIFEFLAPGLLLPGLSARRVAPLVGDYILRRTKQKVLRDLPPKLIRDAELILSPEQQVAYQVAENEGVVRLNDMGQQLTIQHVFELILRLKQICNFDPLTGTSSKADRLEADLEEVAASGQKAIVFSQWVATLDRLQDRLRRFGPLAYHGRIAPRRREQVLQQFREDPRAHVLLMSYGAGSVGLNLQFCNYVFLFDRWWKPAVEDQAINRAHRIGSVGPVTVTRMLIVDTIEQRIERVLEEKRQLLQQIFAHAVQMPSAKLSQQEIFGLFQLPLPSSATAAPEATRRSA